MPPGCGVGAACAYNYYYALNVGPCRPFQRLIKALALTASVPPGYGVGAAGGGGGGGRPPGRAGAAEGLAAQGPAGGVCGRGGGGRAGRGVVKEM